jgi:FkbM family methyltransferase
MAPNRALNRLLGKAHKLAAILLRPHCRIALFKSNVAAALEHLAVLRSMTPASVVDIGANMGQFSLAIREVFPSIPIFAFEPLPDAAAIYRKIFANDRVVTLYQTAVSNERGMVAMHLSKRPDSSSLLPITNLQNQIFPGTQETGILNVSAAPLSDYLSELPSPALLKIDVQGFELEVLRACAASFVFVSHIYVEASFVTLYERQALASEIIAFLQKENFTLSGVYNMSYDDEGVAVQADFLFSRCPPLQS